MPPAHEHSANQASLAPDGDLDPNDREQPFTNNDDNHHGERDDYEMDYGTDGNVAPDISRDANEMYRDYHFELDGHICDAAGNFLPPDTEPPSLTSRQPGDWTPYHNRMEFKTAKFLYKKVQMSASDIDKLMHLWGLGLTRHGDAPPFVDHRDLYSTIDKTPIGDVPWQSFSMKYSADDDPNSSLTPWMDATYTTWFRDPHTIIHNMLGNPNFKNEIDYAPYREWKGTGDSATRQWRNVMLGDWAWDQADNIAKDPATHGSMFVSVILGSDKTTVSVATGQNDYYPLYASIGNVHNNVHRAHRNTVAVIGFLAIPKTTKKHSDDPHFRKFKKQLFHSSLLRILSSLKPAMSIPEVVQFGDGHFRRVLYGLGPYIADYPEQLVLGCVVQNWCAKCFAYPDNLDSGEGGLRSQEVVDTLCEEVDSGVLWDEWGVIGELVPFTNDFPHADIHQLLAPDILHQVIKGAFKDHLVAWVEQYLEKEHGKARAKEILDDIDHRIATAPPFAGLRQFPQGRGFSQWTGNNSKALMKVYLPAIEGHDTLLQLSNCLERFHRYRQIFQDTGIQFDGFSLPRQHALCHYSMLIRLFGAPNGICSSITESKHIKAVKEPWRRSSKFNALGQMLLTNQRLDKLAASRSDFTARGMLDNSYISDHLGHLDRLESARGTTETMQVDAPNGNNHDDSGAGDGKGKEEGKEEGEGEEEDEGEDIQISPTDQADSDRPHLDEPGDGILEGPRAQCDVKLAHTPKRSCACNIRALANELGILDLPHLVRLFLYDQLLTDDMHTSDNVPLSACPRFKGRVKVFNSAAATFFAPSDPSGVGGMRREHIRVVPSWRRGPAHNDTVFINTGSEDGINGMEVSRVLGKTFPCALIHWFKLFANEPNPDTGMWMVRPSFHAESRSRELSIVHVDTIVRACHLLPIFDTHFTPEHIMLHNILDLWPSFYVNKFMDHHMFEIAS
ncbi:uncharacterized protein F5147DRAFT_748792 [Suillus discolor]|uniref:Uncharacterized protein n=1 Tax=Suillus discolor TaxID=1912936 RepID=A0A9P7JLH3_9AGAM|nr:uncharacterized protein F5147DRAFT_748792 [Suillus discolor]KAG2084606.1 hypothetical protein F5147DRAFT_748792 [Suillus discolor]